MEILVTSDNRFELQKLVAEKTEQGYRVKFPPSIAGAPRGDTGRYKGEVEWSYIVVMEKTETQHYALRLLEI